jgi:hypothetical protein
MKACDEPEENASEIVYGESALQGFLLVGLEGPITL